MIQIIAQRAFNGANRPSFVYTEPAILLPSLTTVFAKFNEVLATLPEEERVNLFYTLAHHSGTQDAKKPQRTNSTFEHQTALAFDIDKDDKDDDADQSVPDLQRALEYAACAAKVIQATPEAFTVVTSGNGIHLLWWLKHPIRHVSYFEEERDSYYEILRKLKKELRAAGLGGAADSKIFDAARILRLPGSRNVKAGKAETLCQLVQSSRHQLDTDLFKLSGLKDRKQQNVSAEEIKRQYPAPDFAEMVRECEFVKWAISKPEAVHEPQAFDLFSLLAPQLPDAKAETPWGILGPRALGEHVFNKAVNSASLKNEDFNSKWKQAKEYGGRKCQTIHNSVVGVCEKCPHWGKIPTPLALKSKEHIGSAALGYWVLGEKGQHKYPNYEDLAKIYRGQNEYIVTPENRLMVYNGKFYQLRSDLELKGWVEGVMNPSEPLREAMRMEFVNKIKAKRGLDGLATEEFFESTTRGRLNAANGVLDISAGRIQPHSAEFGFLYALPYSIDLASEGSEAFLDWLGVITQDRPDLMEAILDLMAYVLWPGYDDHLFAYFVGIGANGKSTLIHLIQALVGEKNFSTVGIQQLGENRFAPAQLEGKLVNLSEESSGGGEMDIESMNIIKTLSAGGTLLVERKGVDGFMFTNKAKLIFSANHPPKFKETGHAIQRRMMIIPFDHLIDKPDPAIEKQLISEVPNIAAMLVRRIQDKVRDGGKFKVARGGEAAARAQEKVLHGQNTAMQWGEECLESSIDLGKNVYIRCDEAYGHYKLWCESNGYQRPVTKPQFGKILRTMILTPACQGDACERDGHAVFKVYRYTKFKEGIGNYGPEVRQ